MPNCSLNKSHKTFMAMEVLGNPNLLVDRKTIYTCSVHINLLQQRVRMLKYQSTTSIVILILFSFLKSGVTGQSMIPPTKFMTDFAQFFNSKSIILHTYANKMIPKLIEITKQINKQGYYFVSTNVVQENFTMDFQNVDLHIVFIDDSQSLNFFIDCVTHRKNYHKEPWILYSNNTAKDVLPNIQIAALDLDDEIFLASAYERKTYLEEVYKIGNDSPIDINDVGTWSEIENITFTTRPKWYRRGNLKVQISRISISRSAFLQTRSYSSTKEKCL